MDWADVEINDSEGNTPEDKENKFETLSGLSASPELLHLDMIKRATHLDDAMDQHNRMLDVSGSNPEKHYEQIAPELDIDQFSREMNGTLIDSGIILSLLGCEKDDVSLELGSMEEKKLVRIRINFDKLESGSDLSNYNYFERIFALPKGSSEIKALWDTNKLEIHYE